MLDSFREHDGARDLLALRALPGVGDVGVRTELTRHGSARFALSERDSAARDAAYEAADRALESAAAKHMRVITQQCADYPARLHELHDAPAVLFAQGTMASADPPAVAIVGTRAASSYGIRVARSIATACARAGATVISGMAQGIDGVAHQAALDAGGRTVAVLGTGIDLVFPLRHRVLQAQVARDGLLLSELHPGQHGHAGTFPRRNRIIAALADVTVVIEAGERSGALITANYAHELHRTVACVPNAIDIASSRGSNALMKDFAEPILAADDVLELLKLQAQPTPAPLLDDRAAACWYAIGQGASTLEQISAEALLPTRSVASALSVLELEGLVTVEPDGRVRAV